MPIPLLVDRRSGSTPSAPKQELKDDANESFTCGPWITMPQRYEHGHRNATTDNQDTTERSVAGGNLPYTCRPDSQERQTTT
jgi:hypothetical protein